MSCRHRSELGRTVAFLGAAGIIAMMDWSVGPPPRALVPFGLYLVYVPVAIGRALGGKLAAWISAGPIFAAWAWMVSFEPNWMLADRR
jgi:hypothetical protein